MLIRSRLSYAFNDLYALERVTQATLNLRDHLCKSELGSLQRELNRAQFLLSSYRTRRMSMAKLDIKVRIEMCLEDSCVRYVIVYTNGRIVQGHRVYCLASRVNILSQGKVQRVTVTPRPGRVYSITTVGAYKSSKCHIVVFWRLK